MSWRSPGGELPDGRREERCPCVRTPPVAVLGENLVDLLVAPDGALNGVIGGGPLNVARTIGRLGGDARFLTGVSVDAFGALVRAALEESAVRLVIDRRLVQPTALAVVELVGGIPHYHFHLNDTAAFALGAAECTEALAGVDDLAAYYFGTLGLLVEPMATVGESLVLATPADTLVVIDPNCRPHAVRDEAGYRARVARLCARADVVKVSTEDLAYLYPDRSRHDGARDILGHGAAVVMVTDGDAPVRVLGDHVDLEIDVATIEVVDTVGAGDALVGGFLAWWTGHHFGQAQLHDGPTLRAAVSAAIEISRLTCQRAGAEPPRRDEVLHLEGWRWL